MCLNKYDLEMIKLGGTPSSILDTDKKVRAFYERPVERTEGRFKEFTRARMASELEAKFYYVD